MYVSVCVDPTQKRNGIHDSGGKNAVLYSVDASMIEITHGKQFWFFR